MVAPTTGEVGYSTFYRDRHTTKDRETNLLRIAPLPTQPELPHLLALRPRHDRGAGHSATRTGLAGARPHRLGGAAWPRHLHAGNLDGRHVAVRRRAGRPLPPQTAADAQSVLHV